MLIYVARATDSSTKPREGHTAKVPPREVTNDTLGVGYIVSQYVYAIVQDSCSTL
jgi:hypothetical protein